MSLVLSNTPNSAISASAPIPPEVGEVWRCRITETGQEFDAEVESLVMDAAYFKPLPGNDIFPHEGGHFPGTVEFLHKITQEQA